MSTTTTDVATGRRTVVHVSADRARLEQHGDRALPGIRPVLVGSDGAATRVCLVPDGALLLAGDHVQIEITVEAGCSVELVEPGGTVAYDMRGGSARWDVSVTLGAGARLAWAGEPFIASAGSVVDRRFGVTLDAGARLLLRETLVLGRHGQAPGRIRSRWDAATTAGRPLVVEDLDLDAETLALPGLLGGQRVLASVVALGYAVPGDAAPDGRLDLADSLGTLWRALATDAHEADLSAAWQAGYAAHAAHAGA